MKRFKCEVRRTDEYIIEIDESKLNEEWMEHFRKYFYDFYKLEDHAEHIAQYKARFNSDTFIEGYGTVLVNGKRPPFGVEQSLQTGVNIKVISEDDDCYVDVVEIDEN
jgi:hypothetical protein